MLGESIVYSKDQSGSFVRFPNRLFLAGTEQEIDRWQTNGLGKRDSLHVLPVGALVRSKNSEGIKQMFLSIWTPDSSQIRSMVVKPYGSRWSPVERLQGDGLVAAVYVNEDLRIALKQLYDELPRWAKWDVLENGYRKRYDANMKFLEEVIAQAGILVNRLAGARGIADHFGKASRNFVGIDTPPFSISGLNEEPLVE